MISFVKVDRPDYFAARSAEKEVFRMASYNQQLIAPRKLVKRERSPSRISFGFAKR